MNKNIIYLVVIVALVVGGFFMFSQPANSTIVSTTANNNQTDVQVVKLSVGANGDYVMSPNTLVKGRTVRLEADMSKMPGCSKSIVIREFNVRKTFTTSSNWVEFTPTKTGTFFITCSMNMYQGQFSVVDETGAKSAYSETLASSGGSCGGGGGCGCGG